MSYTIKFSNKTIKDTCYSLKPVNWVLRIFVLNNVKEEQNKLVQCWSWTRTFGILAVMLTTNMLCFVIKVRNFEGRRDGEIKFTDSLQLIYLLGFAEYIVDLVFVYKMRFSCIKYLQFYTNIDKILGVPNFSRIRTKNSMTVVLFVISFAITSIFEYISWGYALDWFEPTLYCLDYIYGFLNSLTVLDVVANVILIEYRTEVILNYIQEYYASTLTLSEDEINSETVEQKVDRLKTVSYTKKFGILSLSKCYVMLMEQVEFINTAYGFRLGAFCLNLLIYLVNLTNIVIRTLVGQFMIPYPTYHLVATATLLRTANYALVLCTLVFRCQETYKQCYSIVRLIDLTIVGKRIPSEVRTALSELRGLVLSRPIKFHGANFFILDYPLLVSVASVVVTYSIILLQSMR